MRAHTPSASGRTGVWALDPTHARGGRVGALTRVRTLAACGRAGVLARVGMPVRRTHRPLTERPVFLEICNPLPAFL